MDSLFLHRALWVRGSPWYRSMIHDEGDKIWLFLETMMDVGDLSTEAMDNLLTDLIMDSVHSNRFALPEGVGESPGPTM